jgi:hypothetical protein
MGAIAFFVIHIPAIGWYLLGLESSLRLLRCDGTSVISMS